MTREVGLPRGTIARIKEVSLVTPNNQTGSQARPAAPASLLALIEKSVRGMDQKLGYQGKDRFVIFYYEPRGEEVIWRDNHSYGFATGAGQLFIDEIAPVAEFHNVDVGISGSSATHVLLIDRAFARAYFVKKDEAIKFLVSLPGHKPVSALAGSTDLKPLDSLLTSVEITQDTIAELAYQIWNNSGRLEGRALQDWLEAEALLRAKHRAAKQPK